ncbi:oxygen-independent coproporphyrinogen III oxidase [Palleronia sp.]|uniref:oxygen-independent coproporphyrinogen III oxidase n=1 Tax=Palleronia sp. TaxID=1940284 RepID=UPI0035C87AA5
MTQDSLRTALLTARVPRYSSYPPADRFTAEVGAGAKDAWLRAIPAGSAVSIYVHVPFCRRLCWFCACRTQGTRKDEPLDRFLEHLEVEIAATRARLPEGVEVSSLHLGGGTPTLLSPDRIDRITAMLGEAFPTGSAQEVSVEVDPCEFDAPRRDALVRMGLSRAFIGVQDSDPMVQAAIGREQSAEQTTAAVRLLRQGGVESISFDLLYGLPYQTEARLLRTVDTVLSLGPERVAVYGYAHVPWVARRQKLIPEVALPSPEARFAQADLARTRLVSAGYVPVGIDHFARPGDSLVKAAESGGLRRNFQGYTTDTAPVLLGLGPSAISRLPQGYVQNAPASDAWQRAVRARGLPAARGIALTAETAAVAAVIERLMCEGAADLAAFDVPQAEALMTTAGEALAQYPGAGLMDGSVLRLSTFAAARLVAHVFDRGGDATAARYSPAC